MRRILTCLFCLSLLLTSFTNETRAAETSTATTAAKAAKAATAATQNAKQKNILFLFADDLTYEAMGYAGLTDIDTPNLDRLAAEGTRFSHAYNSGAWGGAVCVASRAMLNTGRQIWSARTLAQRKSMHGIVKNKQLWSQRMQSQGYRTYFTGKWHVHHVQPGQVFDHASHVRGGMPRITADAYNRPLAGKPDAWSPYDKSKGGFWVGGKHWSEVIADDAELFLKQAQDDNKPFFMYLAFNAAHDPRQAPKRYVDQYPLSRIKVPKNYADNYPFKDSIGCGPDLRDERLAPFPRTKHSIQVHRQEYYALISHMDAQIGRILKALKDSGLAEETVIIFTADHGLAVGHHGLLGKQNMYDHSMRVPMILAGPKIPKNKTVKTPVYLQDVMATSLAIAGDQGKNDFKNLLPKIATEQSGPSRDIYGAYLQQEQRMIIHGDHKLILYPKAKVYRLYDLKDDPQEMHSLAGDKTQNELAIQLFTRFESLQRQLGDRLAIDFSAYAGK